MEVLREGNDESHGGRQSCDRCKCCKQGVAGRAEIVVCQLCQGNAPVFRDLVVVETHRTEIDGCKVDDADQGHSDDAGLGEKDGCLALLSDAERMDGGDDGDAECQSCEGVHGVVSFKEAACHCLCRVSCRRMLSGRASERADEGEKEDDEEHD